MTTDTPKLWLTLGINFARCELHMVNIAHTYEESLNYLDQIKIKEPDKFDDSRIFCMDKNGSEEVYQWLVTQIDDEDQISQILNGFAAELKNLDERILNVFNPQFDHKR